MEREGGKPLEGRVAWLILLVVASVCVVCCVLCCLKKTIWSLVNQITTGKKVQSSGRWLEKNSDNHLLCQNMNTNYDWKKIQLKKKVQLSGCWLE
jgi:hypothetical protein